MKQGVPEGYVRILSNLYTDQKGHVKLDKTSRTFNIRRGTKQDDPLSPILFNAALEFIMGPIRSKWAAADVGIKIKTNY